MPLIEKSIDVDRPISEVWDLWTDVRILPDLSSSTVAVTGAPLRLTAKNQSFGQIIKAAGRCTEVQWVVTEIEPCEHLTITAEPKLGVHVKLSEIVERLGAARTRLTLRIEYKLPFGPVGALVSKLGVAQLSAKEAGAVLEGLARRLGQDRAVEVSAT